MAVVRARSTPPYATIIFVFLWVIATGVAIWLAVQKGDTEKKLADANAKVAAVSKTNADTGASSNRLKTIIVAEPGKSVDDAVTEASKALQDTGEGTLALVPAIHDLATRAQQSEKTANELKDQNADFQNKLVAATKAQDAAATASNTTLNQEKASADAALAEAAKERADRESQIAAAQAAFTKANDDWEKKHRQDVLDLEQLKQDIATRDNIIKQKNDQLAARRQTATTLAGIEPAGIVVRARPGTRDCYISLGRKDRITPGLTFSVHDPRIGVKLPTETDLSKPTPDSEAGGKASIEVVSVGETESLCRITNERHGQHVEQGDLIANLFYQQDKNKKFHFVVFGDFDLDGDGVATAAEHDRVVRLITASGGIIDDKISPDTDYLVPGSRPAAPQTHASTEPGGVADQQAVNEQTYDNLFVGAKRSSIPILNGNRFLTFIGYYNNTVAQ